MKQFNYTTFNYITESKFPFDYWFCQSSINDKLPRGKFFYQKQRAMDTLRRSINKRPGFILEILDDAFSYYLDISHHYRAPHATDPSDREIGRKKYKEHLFHHGDEIEHNNIHSIAIVMSTEFGINYKLCLTYCRLRILTLL